MPPRLLILSDDSPLSSLVASSAQEGALFAGGAADVLSEKEIEAWPGGFDDVAGFLLIARDGAGFTCLHALLSPHVSWPAHHVSLIQVHHGTDSKTLELASQLFRSSGSPFPQTLSLSTHGLLSAFGRGTLTESDLARAKAAGERLVRSCGGRFSPPRNEKLRIAGYRKP